MLPQRFVLAGSYNYQDPCIRGNNQSDRVRIRAMLILLLYQSFSLIVSCGESLGARGRQKGGIVGAHFIRFSLIGLYSKGIPNGLKGFPNSTSLSFQGLYKSSNDLFNITLDRVSPPTGPSYALQGSPSSHSPPSPNPYINTTTPRSIARKAQWHT